VRSRAYNSQKKGGRYQVCPLLPVSEAGRIPPVLLPGNSWCRNRPNLDRSQIDVDHLHRIDAALRHRRSKYSDSINCIYDL
jgi:hypothetical protein